MGVQLKKGRKEYSQHIMDWIYTENIIKRNGGDKAIKMGIHRK